VFLVNVAKFPEFYSLVFVAEHMHVGFWGHLGTYVLILIIIWGHLGTFLGTHHLGTFGDN